MYSARLPLVLVLAIAACQLGPTSGTTAAGTVIGQSFLFQGFFNQPNEVIVLEVMTDPSQDPSVAASWVKFATAVTSTTETIINRPDPLFAWSVNAIPVPNAGDAARWPQGGLVRVRAVHPSTDGDTILVTFDDVTFSNCLNEQLAAGADWVTIGTQCQGLGDNNAAMVSTSNVPVAAGTAATGGGFLGKKGTVAATTTAAYYTATAAPTTLAGFKTTFGFPVGELTATYYNDADLGLGREVHCKAFATHGVACFSTMYSGVAGVPAFNVDPSVVLGDAVARAHSFTTLAMTFDGTTGGNSVKFMAYDVNGNLATTAQLDSTGNNKSIPNSCLSCHGINATFTAATNTVSGDAKLLPFDVLSFKYSTTAGFTFADQADQLRRLNALVKSANPTRAIAEMLDGMYAPKLISDPTAVANNTFIPDAWKTLNGNLDGTALYNGLIKVGCRTCHVSAVTDALDFNSPADVSSLVGAVRSEVCGATHIMPHSERAMKKFWESGARAYLVTGFPAASFPDPLQACKP